jgi:hypothetical protein
LDTLAFNLFYDGTNYRRWLGEQLDNATYGTTGYAPFTQSFLYGWDVAGGAAWHRINTDAAGSLITNQSTTTPGYVRMQDGNGTTLVDNLVMAGADIATTEVGVYSLAGNYFWGNTLAKFTRWYGNALVADTATPTVPFVGSFGMVYDIANTNWNMMTSHLIADNLSATPEGLDALSYTLFYNGSNYQRWTGSILSGETIANTTYAPHDKSMIYGYDATSSSWRWVNVLDTQADNLATSLNSMMTTSVMMGYDGATLDMARLGAVGELQVTDVATRPGEDVAADLVKVKKVDTGVWAPNKETSGVISNVAVTVCASKEVLSYPNWCISLKNNDAADPFVDASIYDSPDGASWEAMTWTACDSLAFGQLCTYCYSGNAYRYIYVSVTAGAVAQVTSVDCWITASKN